MEIYDEATETGRVASWPMLEVADDIVIQLGHFTPDGVQIKLAPNIQDYRANADKSGVFIRQVTVTTGTDETRSLFFDLKTNATQVISFGGRNVEIKLMQIGREKFEAQDFLSYEFQVSDSDVGVRTEGA